MTTTTDQKNQYAKSICYFLAELLRTRRISLERAADISQKMIDNINLLDSEHDFLQLTKTLAQDFEELIYLKERISLDIGVLKRKDLEDKVRQFVVNVLPNDTTLALNILEEAIKSDIELSELGKKFPEFGQFLTKTPWQNNQPPKI